MDRKEQIICVLICLIMGTMILSAIDDVAYLLRHMKINVAFPSASGSLIEGDAVAIPDAAESD